MGLWAGPCCLRREEPVCRREGLVGVLPTGTGGPGGGHVAPCPPGSPLASSPLPAPWELPPYRDTSRWLGPPCCGVISSVPITPAELLFPIRSRHSNQVWDLYFLGGSTEPCVGAPPAPSQLRGARPLTPPSCHKHRATRLARCPRSPRLTPSWVWPVGSVPVWRDPLWAQSLLR